jgi:hypothetical protein
MTIHNASQAAVCGLSLPSREPGRKVISAAIAMPRARDFDRGPVLAARSFLGAIQAANGDDIGK